MVISLLPGAKVRTPGGGGGLRRSRRTFQELDRGPEVQETDDLDKSFESLLELVRRRRRGVWVGGCVCVGGGGCFVWLPGSRDAFFFVLPSGC